MVEKEYWVVCGNTRYYPWVSFYDDEARAIKAFEEAEPWVEVVVLAKVVRHKKSEDAKSIDYWAKDEK